jgi:hypothetical protein
MKAFLILIVLAGAGYFGYRHWMTGNDAAPEVIENPVYASRLTARD